ncbi:MAG: terminase family protein [Methylobacillus sp.]|jgi:hypothetical protein|nr:terminase family protein [Methylobacillus sp.]
MRTAEIDALVIADIKANPWRPLAGPQMAAYFSKADVMGYGGSAGGGKGLALDTLLPTPAGWVSMRDVAVGDTLFDESGRVCNVIAVSDVSARPCFRLTFDDGSSIVADDVHRWVTFDAKELSALTRKTDEWRAARRAKRPSRAKPTTSQARLAALARLNSRDTTTAPPCGTMRDTALLSATLRTSARRANHAIQVAHTLELPDVALPIPPYTLGAWLGDGSSRNGQITNPDQEVLRRIERDGFLVRSYDSLQHNVIGLSPLLRRNGLLMNKHVPPEYFRAGTEQRLALLQGLMDTDGHAATDGQSQFDSTNEALADAVLQLVMSLGIKATKVHGRAKLNGRDIGDKWRIQFTTAKQVFFLNRKRARLPEKTRRTGAFRYLVSCEQVESVPTRCIAVDSQSRQYLAGTAFIPTHNTELAIGMALTAHDRSLILRREKAQTEGIVQRMGEVLGSTHGYNSQRSAWKLPNGGLCEFGGLDNMGDESRWQGRPHDLIVLDEATEIRKQQALFVMGWNRTAKDNQRCRVLMTFNPPTNVEGRWVIEYFAPWLDVKHPNPAKPGELRWFTTIDGDEREVESGEPFELNGETIRPRSRTFIPSRIGDNPFLVGTGYEAMLQAMPEPLRSQMLYGDFSAGVEDDPWQVIPTKWVEAAQKRWTKPNKIPPMDSMGVDIARGGKDQTVIARRHGMWFDEPIAYPGSATPDGATTAGLIIAALRNRAVIHLDVIGVGSSPYDFLNEAGQQVIGVNVAEAARSTDKSGRLRFYNLRSELWWKMREALDPVNNTGICLPPDSRLLADLTAPTWSMSGATVKVASRDEIIERIGRSPDYGSAYILALMDSIKLDRSIGRVKRDYDPYDLSKSYDPYRT